MYSYCGGYSVHMFSDKPPFIPDTSNREFPADFLNHPQAVGGTNAACFIEQYLPILFSAFLPSFEILIQSFKLPFPKLLRHISINVHGS